MATPKRANEAWRDAVERFKRIEFPQLTQAVLENMSGRIMRTRSGRTLQNILAHSRLLKNGFKVATTSPSLIAWMKGSARRSFFVRPKTRKVLHWQKGGQDFFSRGHQIPAWRFTPVRPVLKDAVERRQDAMVKTMEDLGLQAIRQVFPNERRVVRIRI